MTAQLSRAVFDVFVSQFDLAVGRPWMAFVTAFSFTAIRHRIKVEPPWSHVRGPDTDTRSTPRQSRPRAKGKGGERVSHGLRSNEPTPYPQGPEVGRQVTLVKAFFRVVVFALLMRVVFG